MAVIGVLEQFTGRKGGDDYKATREYDRVFKVITDSLVDDSITISAAAGIPRLFDIYVGSDGLYDPLAALCNKIDIDCVGEFEWMVRCHYSNKCDWPDLANLDPLLRPSEISWSSVEATRAGVRDTNGKAYVNSANEKFSPPHEVADTRLQLVIRKNLQGYDPNLGLTYTNSVNSDAFMGAPPGYALCKGISAERHYENHIFYWGTTYTIQFKNLNQPSWQPLILDQGYYSTHPTTGNPLGNKDDYASPLQSPVLMDGQGGLLKNATGVTGALGLPIGTDFVIAGTNPAWLSKATFPINVLVDSELITILGPNPATPGHFKCIRGAGGTTQAAHAPGATVALQPVFLQFAEHPSLPFAALNIP